MFNIENLLIQKQIEYRKEGKNVSRGEYSICCPFCNENRFHCGINPKKGLFNCWICSSSGSIERLISKLLGISYIEAKEIVNPISELKKVLEERENKKTTIEEIKNIKNFKLPEHTYTFRQDRTNLWQEAALKFLRSKYNLTWQHIVDANLYYCVYGKYKNSIIIPCYFNNKMVNFICRSWDKNSNIRYRNCPNEESIIDTKKLLFNWDNIKQGGKHLIITEGAFDCIKVKSVFPSVVAMLGTEVTSHQIELLISKKAKNYYIMFDNDPHLKTTSKKAQDLANYLSAFAKTKIILLPFGKDPADLEGQEMRSILNIYDIN